MHCRSTVSLYKCQVAAKTESYSAEGKVKTFVLTEPIEGMKVSELWSWSWQYCVQKAVALFAGLLSPVNLYVFYMARFMQTVLVGLKGKLYKCCILFGSENIYTIH